MDQSISEVLTPEDIRMLDIKELSDSDEKEGKRSPKKESILFTVAVLLFLIGYLIAPNPVVSTQYTVKLEYDDTNINFQINIVDTQVNLPETIDLEYDTFTIQYVNSFINEQGNTIRFLLIPQITPDEIPTDELVAYLSNDNSEYRMIGKITNENYISYQFKILSDTRIAMGLLFSVAFLWLTELIPLAASSMLIPVILVITEIQSATQALSYFSQPIIFLFLAGFLMAEAMHRTKLDKFISYRIFAFIPPNGKLLLFSMMCLSAVFSMFMSNTAAVAILIPLAIQLLKGVDVGDTSYRKTMVLGIAYAATIGGIGSIIGTPPNIIASELLKEFNPEFEISFLEWFMFGLPVVFVMLPITFYYLWKRFNPIVSEESLKKAQIQTKMIITEELKLTKNQAIVSIIFIITFVLWLTTSIHGLDTSIIAVQAAVLLFLMGQLEEGDLNVINWNALLTFGGGLALGSLVIQTGLADYIGSYAISLVGFPQLLILFVIALLGLILTAFASNTASAVILVPIVLPLGYILGISPITLAILVAIAASVDFAIVIGTPPTMIAYSTGFFKVKEIFRIGIFIDLIGLVVISLLSTFLFGMLVVYI